MTIKAVILAAGYGSRLFPVTRVVPKELLPLVNKPVLQFVLDELVEAGISDILVITSARKQILEKWFAVNEELTQAFSCAGKEEALQKLSPPNLNVTFVQQEKMLGTGQALLLAEEFVGDDPFIVAYPDDIFMGDNCSEQLIAAYKTTGCSVLATSDGQRLGLDLSRYGVLDLDDNAPYRNLRGIVEKPAPGSEPSTFVSWGRYLFTPELFKFLKLGLKSHQGGEYYHVGAIGQLAKEGKVVVSEVTGTRLDTGTTQAYVRTFFEVALADPEVGPDLLSWIQKRTVS